MLAKLDRYECAFLDDIGYVHHDRDEMEVPSRRNATSVVASPYRPTSFFGLELDLQKQ
jgi:hypothetical protein